MPDVLVMKTFSQNFICPIKIYKWKVCIYIVSLSSPASDFVFLWTKKDGALRLREIKFASDIFLGTPIHHIREPNYLSDHWLTTGKSISKMLSFQAKAKVQIKLPTNQSTLQFQPLFAKRSFKSLLLCFTAYFSNTRTNTREWSLVRCEEVPVLVVTATYHHTYMCSMTHGLTEKEFRVMQRDIMSLLYV